MSLMKIEIKRASNSWSTILVDGKNVGKLEDAEDNVRYVIMEMMICLGVEVDIVVTNDKLRAS